MNFQRKMQKWQICKAAEKLHPIVTNHQVVAAYSISELRLNLDKQHENKPKTVLKN
jgi:hypothetical protein